MNMEVTKKKTRDLRDIRSQADTLTEGLRKKVVEAANDLWIQAKEAVMFGYVELALDRKTARAWYLRITPERAVVQAGYRQDGRTQVEWDRDYQCYPLTGDDIETPPRWLLILVPDGLESLREKLTTRLENIVEETRYATTKAGRR
jgi:hypothetical protein